MQAEVIMRLSTRLRGGRCFVAAVLDGGNPQRTEIKDRSDKRTPQAPTRLRVSIPPVQTRLLPRSKRCITLSHEPQEHGIAFPEGLSHAHWRQAHPPRRPASRQGMGQETAADRFPRAA